MYKKYNFLLKFFKGDAKMKKLFAIMLSLMLSVGAVIPTQNVYAASYDWTDGYYSFLHSTASDINRTNFDQYALYDLNFDTMPELILKNPNLNGSYRIYTYKDSTVNFERQLANSGFYLDKEGKLVIAYGDIANTTYVYYEPTKSVTNSTQLLKAKRDKKISDDEWEWLYFHYEKEVSKYTFDTLLEEELQLIELEFSDIDVKNTTDDVLMGMGFTSRNSIMHYAGEKDGFGINARLNFTDNSIASAKDGNTLVPALLMINGLFISDIFPIYENDTTLVPVRAVSEGLNAKVEWDANLRKITINNDFTVIEMYIGELFAVVDGERKELAVAPVIVNSSTYVPVRFVSENLDCNVFYQEGIGNLLPIIGVENKYSNLNVEKFVEIEEDDALAKVELIVKSIDWSSGQGTLIHAAIDKNVSVKPDERLLVNRFWIINLDTGSTQKILVDKYTGHIYSMYDYGNNFGITLGFEDAIKAMRYIY